MSSDSPIPTASDIKEFREDQRQLTKEYYELRIEISNVMHRVENNRKRIEQMDLAKDRIGDKAWDVIKSIGPWPHPLIYLGFKEWSKHLD